MSKEKVQTQHAQEPNLAPLIRTKRRKALSTPATNTISRLATTGTGKDVSTRAQTMTTLQRHVGNHKAAQLMKAPIQTKLKVGAPNDKYEQEADSVARQVTASGPTTDEDMAQTKPKIQRMMGQEDEEKAMMQAEPDAPVADEEAVQMQADAMAPTEDEEAGTIHRQAEAPVTEDADEDQVSQMDADGPSSTDDEEGVSLQTKSQSTDGASSVSPDVESGIHQARGGGQRLPESVQASMGDKFGADFSGVNVHTDGRADQLNRSLGARAFTTGQDIFFKRGEYDPGNSGGRELLAHELTHVVQQNGEVQESPVRQKRKRNPSVRHQVIRPTLQRTVEIRPAEGSRANAFDRRQELVDRLNDQSTAIRYHLEGRRLAYDIVDEAMLSNFDRQMQGFLDQEAVVPMRLITSAGYVRDQRGRLGPLLVDSFELGYVDLDDVLASDNASFQSMMVHLLAERFSVRNYARRTGTNLNPSFNRAHRIGRAAETELFRGMLNDPSIRFNYERVRNGTLVVAFRSMRERYHLFIVIRGGGRERRGGVVRVRTRDGRRLSIDAFRAERAAARVSARP